MSAGHVARARFLVSGKSSTGGSVSRLRGRSGCCLRSPHQARMEDPKFWSLPKGWNWRNAEPLVCVRNSGSTPKIELRGKTEARCTICFAVHWRNQEFARVKAVSLLRCSVGYDDGLRFVSQCGDPDNESRSGLRPRLPNGFREAAINDVTEGGKRKLACCHLVSLLKVLRTAFP